MNSAVLEHRGCRIAYDLCGEGPPVLLIQGVGVHGNGWQPQVEALAKTYACMTFDNRGVGRSQPLAVRLSVKQMAEDTQALMDAAGWESAHVVGHSLGGLIALDLALASPQRVRSLSLLCTSACGRDLVQLSWWAFWIGMRTRLGAAHYRRRAFLEIVMPPKLLATTDRDALAESLMPIFGYDLAQQPTIALKQTLATRAYDATPQLHKLAGTPTLVVSGEQDRIAPAKYGQALAERIRGSRYVEFPDAAHGLTIQCAEEVNQLLLEHLAEAESRPRGLPTA